MTTPSHKIRPDVLFGVFIGIIIVYIGIAFALDYYKGLAFLGKYSGTLESIFSSLAFAGLLYTIYQQQITIQTQVDEMRETRQQAIAANEIFKRQTDLLEIQEISNGFFRHYDVSHRLLVLIEVEKEGKTLKGNRYFDYLVTLFYESHLKTLVSKSNEQINILLSRPNAERLLNELSIFFDDFENSQRFYPILLPYLKSLVLNVEYFVNTKFKDKRDKEYYSTLLRFSIEPKAAKLICFIYLWSDETKYPSLYQLVNELNLWAHFNFSHEAIDGFIRSEIKQKLIDYKPSETDL